jgi:hypothetical protein
MRKQEIGLEFSKTDTAANGITKRVTMTKRDETTEPQQVLKKHNKAKDEDNLMNRGDFKFFYSGRKLL